MADYVSYKVHSLESLQLEDIQCFLNPYLKDYFWHFQPFHLVQTDQHTLEGKTIFEDAIGDEWKIVDLLFKISGNFPVLIQ